MSLEKKCDPCHTKFCTIFSSIKMNIMMSLSKNEKIYLLLKNLLQEKWIFGCTADHDSAYANLNYHLTVCSYHVTYAFQSESTLYSCLNVKELLAQSRREIWSLNDCNRTRTQNHLVRKRTLNHLAKLTKLSLSKLSLLNLIFLHTYGWLWSALAYWLKTVRSLSAGGKIFKINTFKDILSKMTVTPNRYLKNDIDDCSLSVIQFRELGWNWALI